MAREKEDFRENLVRITETFGNVQLIPIQKIAKFVGCDADTLKRDKTFPLKKVGRLYYAAAVSLARWLS